jgi:tetratricopeptide (TPR) repeat protein
MELAHDYWLSGNAYFYLEKYKEACRYYQKALFLIIKDEDSGKQHAFTQLLLAGVYNNGYTLGGPTYVGISRLLLFNNLITAYLRAGDIDAGMEYSLKFLSLFKEIEDKGHINRPDVISGAYYSIACAYALKKDKVDALKYVEKSIAIDSSKKKEIRGDTDLKIIWDDEKFKSLTAE